MSHSKKPVQIYAVFHMNLAFSSIPTEDHARVIAGCYWPLLRLVEQHDIPLGLELTAYTLDCIEAVDPHWISRFRELLSRQRCELIASGDSQIIGPLIPEEVNRQNLRLGLQRYHSLLGVIPRLAYINEQAVSAGLLDIYLDEGFESVVIEWDNPSSYNPEWQPELLHRPQSLKTASGRSIKVIWNHAIAFQKFQRYVHGELVLDDYLAYLTKVIKPDCMAFPLYGSDAEVFDYRPGRYNTEAEVISGEWQRIETLFLRLVNASEYSWCLPCETLAHWQETVPLALTSAEHPVSVKKQAKYNITRWALSGRNDLLMNTLCFKRYQELMSASGSEEQWRVLCRLWASDLRTHLTGKRYEELPFNASQLSSLPSVIAAGREDARCYFDEARRKLHIATDKVRLVLNANRGLSIERLAFASQNFEPVIGTLSHGHFDHISYGADFYSNHLVMERFRERDRVTDLNKVPYQIHDDQHGLLIRCEQSSKQGRLGKWYRIQGESLECGFDFADHLRPEASLRLGFITLLDCSRRAWYAAHLGSQHLEFFQSRSDFNQGDPVSSIVSATSAVGATEGIIYLGSGAKGVRLQWDPACCAPLPMLSSQQINDAYLNRLWFSLIEADETLKAGGYLPNFSYTITPCSLPLPGVAP
jgi:Uncharacterized conserved protein